MPAGALLTMDRVVSEKLRWGSSNHAANVGNLVIFALPVMLGGATAFSAWQEEKWEQVSTDLLLVAETIAVSGLVAQTIKYAVGRERSLAAELPMLDKKRTPEPADNNLSFYSQHTNLAFSLFFLLELLPIFVNTELSLGFGLWVCPRRVLSGTAELPRKNTTFRWVLLLDG